MKLLVVCSGGMSTSLLVEAMKKAAGARGLSCEIQAGAASAVEELADRYDAILVAPQVRHRFAAIQEAARRHDTPVALIPPEMYGKVEGDRVLALVHEMLTPSHPDA